jgi:SsrA-binding protein
MPGKGRRTEQGPPVFTNSKARHRYELLERFECGIALLGPEVKSLRAGNASLDESYARFEGGELWLVGMHIDEYDARGYAPHEPTRSRKLLLHRRELRALQRAVERRGLTLVPVKLYFNERGIAKLQVALARGRQLRDRRDVERAREAEREIDRVRRRR